jgi:hypothetical protein
MTRSISFVLKLSAVTRELSSAELLRANSALRSARREFVSAFVLKDTLVPLAATSVLIENDARRQHPCALDTDQPCGTSSDID